MEYMDVFHLLGILRVGVGHTFRARVWFLGPSERPPCCAVAHLSDDAQRPRKSMVEIRWTPFGPLNFGKDNLIFTNTFTEFKFQRIENVGLSATNNSGQI